MEPEASGSLPWIKQSVAVKLRIGEMRAQAVGQGGEGLVIERVQQRGREPLFAHELGPLVGYSPAARRGQSRSSAAG